MSSLEKKAISGIKWTTIQTVLSALTGPGLLYIKSWFLDAEEFGRISIILVVIGIIKLMEVFGISQAIVQRDYISKKETGALFLFNIGASLFFCAALYFSSPHIASFYTMPDLSEYLRLSILVVLFSGPALLFRAFLQKELYFKHLALLDMGANLLVFLVTTLLLVSGEGIAGVVWGQVAGALFTTLIVCILVIRLKIAPLTLNMRLASVAPFLRFGAFVSGKQIINYLSIRLDELVIGYVLGSEILGVYHFGKNMLEKIRGLITKSFTRIVYPVFARIKHSKDRLSRIFLRITKYVSLATFPVFTGIAITAHLFIPVFFHDEWIDSIIVLQVFSITMMFMILAANVSTSLLYAVNKPEVIFYVDLATVGVYFLALIQFASFGIVTVLAIHAAFIVIKTVVLQYYTDKSMTYHFTSYLKHIAPALLASGTMALAVLLLQWLLTPHISTVLLMSISIISGITVFILSIFAVDKKTLHELKRAIVKGEVTEGTASDKTNAAH